jgi:hypothetical protein
MRAVALFAGHILALVGLILMIVSSFYDDGLEVWKSGVMMVIVGLLVTKADKRA